MTNYQNCLGKCIVCGEPTIFEVWFMRKITRKDYFQICDKCYKKLIANIKGELNEIT